MRPLLLAALLPLACASAQRPAAVAPAARFVRVVEGTTLRA
ncbi:MAG: hypothetical protein JWM10_4561, partial [Myxococcaceae bacterium]|nr:hypothetical protein [Myxococcaceae bacterium]